MIDPAGRRNVIRANAVRKNTQPVLVDCGDGVGSATDRALSVVPLMNGREVAGIEVHCSCGSSVIIECIYDSAERGPTESVSPESLEVEQP